MKYAFKQTAPVINSYIVSCSDASGYRAECVFKMFHEFQQAYNTHKLKSLHSQSNLLNITHSDVCNSYSVQFSRVAVNMCAVSESDSVHSFLMKMSQTCLIFFSLVMHVVYL